MAIENENYPCTVLDMVTMVPLLVLVTFLIHVGHASIDCVSVYGIPSGSNDGDESIAVCGSSYTLVSCGFQTMNATAFASFDGSYIINQTCIARNGPWNQVHPMYGVQAIARCCQLSKISGTCTTYQSVRSIASDDESTQVQCPSSTILVGCGISTDGGVQPDSEPALDGAYPLDPWQFYSDPEGYLTATDNLCM